MSREAMRLEPPNIDVQETQQIMYVISDWMRQAVEDYPKRRLDEAIHEVVVAANKHRQVQLTCWRNAALDRLDLMIMHPPADMEGE